MKYRRLGKTDLKTSVVGVGTHQFCGEWGVEFTKDEVDEILGKAGELGVNLIDTAECYGDHLAEKFIGNSIHKNRQAWVIATKFGHQYLGPNDRRPAYAPAAVLKQLEGSLASLRTDYIDLYQFHSGDDKDFDNDDLWTMLDKQVQAGKIRHLGISIAFPIVVDGNLHQIEQAAKVKATVVQVPYNRLERLPEDGILPLCQRQGLVAIARVPLGKGYLSGKYKPGAEFPANDVRSTIDPEATEAKLKDVDQVVRYEVPEGVAMSQWALAWCLQNPAVATVIPGCKNTAQVESNAAAAGLAMVRDDHPLVWR